VTRDSTVAIESPIDEGAAKPWMDEEPPPAPSEVSGTVVRASFLLQMLEEDSTPGKGRSLDGQHELQAVFECAQHDCKGLEGTRPTSTGVSILPAAYTILLMYV
jgi:hypothetical protein